MPTNHPAESIAATCLMCAPDRETTVAEWKQMLWTLALVSAYEFETAKEN